MRVATITLNPAIDQTVRVDGFQPHHVNRSQQMQFNAGGKGVNVASFLADYGCEVVVTGFLGQDNPHLFDQLFTHKGIADHFIRIPGLTRTNIKIVDEANQQTTDINMQGLVPNAAAIRQLYDTVDELARQCDWFVLAGKLPPTVPDTIYARLISQIKRAGKRVALDTSGDALHEGVLAGPTLVKPNIHELEQLVGRELVSVGEVLDAAAELLTYDTEIVVVSMGEHGAYFVTCDEIVQAVPPAVTIKTTVGAGDAMVAGVVAGQMGQLPLADCARLATAFSISAISQVGAHLPSAPTLQTYQQKVTVEKILRLLVNSKQ